MHHPDYYRQFLIYSGEHWDIFLYVDDAFTCYLGRIYIWSKREENGGTVDIDIDQLSEEEIVELYILRKRAKNVLYRLFKPDRFNWGELANCANHPHGHLIPRYRLPQKFKDQLWEDHNWGKNVWPYNIKRVADEEEKFALLEILKDAFSKEFS